MMTQGQVLTSDPAKVVWGHRGHQQVFAGNLRLSARDIKVVSMCLSRQYASTDMQLGSRRDLDLRSNFDLDLSRSCYTCFHASWGKHDGVKIIALSFQTQKLSLKNCFAQKCRFWPFVTWHLNGWSWVKSDGTPAKECFKSYLLFFWIWRSYYSSRDNGRHSW